MGPGHEVNESIPCTAEVGNERRYTSATPICPYGVDRGKIDLFCLYLAPSLVCQLMITIAELTTACVCPSFVITHFDSPH